MAPAVLLASGSLTWYVSRATGVVSLAFLTASVLLGIVTSFRWSSPNWPRFVVEFVHRNVSLLVVVFVAVHVVVVVADSFAPIGVLDAFVPFISSYRPLWLGFGAIASDLVIALVVTSLLRHRLGYRSWRLVHWLAYLCWPVAVLHGLGTGSDTKSGVILAVTAACVVLVLVAAGLRLGVALRDRPGARVAGVGALAVLPVLLVSWLVAGPLADGWARKSGTPASVLASSGAAAGTSAAAPVTTTPSVASVPTTVTPTTRATPEFGAGGFRADARGTYQQSGTGANGQVTVSLQGSFSGGTGGSVDVEILGRPSSGGGVVMSSGSVTVSDGHHSYQGDIVGLEGGNIVARMPGPGGSDWQVQVVLTQLDRSGGTMAAQVQAVPAGSVSDRRGDDDR